MCQSVFSVDSSNVVLPPVGMGLSHGHPIGSIGHKNWKFFPFFPEFMMVPSLGTLRSPLGCKAASSVGMPVEGH